MHRAGVGLQRVGLRGNHVVGDSPDGCAGPAGAARSRWGWRAAVVVVAVAVIGWVVWRFRGSGFRWQIFASVFQGLAWPWVVVSALLILGTYFGRALRWAVMLRPVKASPSLWNLFFATAVGFTAVVLLGRVGEFVRPYLISVKERVSLSSQVAAWSLERIYDLLAVLMVFGIAVSQVDPSRGMLGPGLRWALQAGGYLVGALSAVCLVVLVLMRQFSDRMRQRLLDALGFLPAQYLERAEAVISAFMEGLASTRQASAVGWVVLYTFLEWMLIAGGYWCLFRATPWTAGFGLGDVVVFMGFVSLGSLVQIPGIGGGVQVVSAVVLREIFLVPLEPAVAMAVLIWTLTFVVVVPFGLLLAIREGISLATLRGVREKVKL